MNTSIGLSFKYTKDDVVAALRAHYRSRLRLPMDIGVTILLLVIGSYFWRSSETHWLGTVFVISAAVFSVILIGAFTVIPPLIFRREPKYHDQYSLDFSSQGIHFRAVHIDSRLEWSIYTQVLITAQSYILYYGSSALTVIPTRVFENNEQQKAFDELVAANVPKIIRK